MTAASADPAPPNTNASVVEDAECPYAGFSPYTARLKNYFFGRADDVQRIAGALYAAPLTILYGASGVGKSSVLMAGLEPELADDRNVIFVMARSWQGEGFAEEVKRDLIAAATKHGVVFEPADVSLRFDLLIAKCLQKYDGWIFFVFDQFEEYLQYDVERRRDGFDAELAAAINRRDLRANFLIAMRQDELVRLDRLRKRIPNLLNSRIHLRHLDLNTARSVIVKPLAAFKEVHGEGHGPTDIDPELVGELLTADVNFDTGGVGSASALSRLDPVLAATAPITTDTDFDEAVVEMLFLQLVLTKLWHVEKAAGQQKIRQGTYDRLGRSQRIVRSHVDNVMDKLPRADKRLAAEMFHYLVTPVGGKVAYPVEGLAALVDADLGRSKRLLDTLGEAKILQPVVSRTRGTQTIRYEIAHDRLALPLLQWRREQIETRRTRITALQVGAVIGIFFLFLYATGQMSTRQFRARTLADEAIHRSQSDPAEAAFLAIRASDLSAPYFYPDDRLTRRMADSVVREIMAQPLVFRADGATEAVFSDEGLLIVSDTNGVVVRQPPAFAPVFSLSAAGSAQWEIRRDQILFYRGDTLSVYRIPPPVAAAAEAAWAPKRRVLGYGAGRTLSIGYLAGGGVIRIAPENAGDSTLTLDASTLASLNRATLPAAGSWTMDSLGRYALVRRTPTTPTSVLNRATGQTFAVDSATVTLFSPDGRFLVNRKRARIEIASLASWPPRVVASIPVGGALRFSPRNNFFVVDDLTRPFELSRTLQQFMRFAQTDSAPTVRVYDTRAWTKAPRKIDGSTGWFDPSETRFLTIERHREPSDSSGGPGRRRARLWDARSWRTVEDAGLPAMREVTRGGFAPDSNLAWLLDAESQLVVFDLQKKRTVFSAPPALPRFDAGGEFTAVMSNDTLRVFQNRMKGCEGCKTRKDSVRFLEPRIAGLSTARRKELLRDQ